MSHPASSPAVRTARRRPRKDPFRYGYRWVDGEMVPLTYADVLDPQLGDFVAENTIHNQLREVFRQVISRRFSDRDDVAVWSDLKLRFDTAGKGPAPDLSVVEGVEDPKRRRGSFWVGRDPGRVLLVMEIVSREYRYKDYRDVKITYQRHRIPEMILVDPLGDYLSDPARLSGYRLQSNGLYAAIPVEDGGLVSLQTDLWIATDPEAWWGFAVVDLRTGERLLTWEEESERLRTAEEEVAAAEERAKLAELRTAAARDRAVRAEKRMAAATERASAATERASAAEERAEQEARARQAAEARALRADAARQAEKEKLLAEIERLRSSL